MCDKEHLVTLTEQGNYGLGVGHVTDPKEKEEVRRRLEEMKKQTQTTK